MVLQIKKNTKKKTFWKFFIQANQKFGFYPRANMQLNLANNEENGNLNLVGEVTLSLPLR